MQRIVVNGEFGSVRLEPQWSAVPQLPHMVRLSVYGDESADACLTSTQARELAEQLVMFAMVIDVRASDHA